MPILTGARTGSWPALAALGIAKGDRVALLAPNCPEYFELQFACGRLGAIMLPLNWRLTVPELEYILGDLDAEASGVTIASFRRAG